MLGLFKTMINETHQFYTWGTPVSVIEDRFSGLSNILCARTRHSLDNSIHNRHFILARIIVTFFSAFWFKTCWNVSKLLKKPQFWRLELSKALYCMSTPLLCCNLKANRLREPSLSHWSVRQSKKSLIWSDFLHFFWLIFWPKCLEIA